MTYSDLDICKLFNHEIVIHPLKNECLQGNGVDLRIGIIKPLSQIDNFKEHDDYIEIPPSGYCIVITKEYIWLSGKLIGTLHARGTLAAKGLYTNATNVDPNFQGQMIMSVFNVSEHSIKLRKDETFITLILHRVRSRTKTLVGDENSKKSMRVIKTFRDEIYFEGQKYEKHRESISKIENYYTDSMNNTSGAFEEKVRAAKSSSYIKRKLKNFKSFLQGKNVTQILFITILMVLFLFFAYGIYKTYEMKNEFDSIRIALAAFSLVSIYNTLKNK